MNDSSCRKSLLDSFYRQFLKTEQSAALIKAVAERYTPATISRLTNSADRHTRRAAVLALGFLSGYEANDVLGRALHDSDRGVRMLAEDGLQQVWFRTGTDSQRHTLAMLTRMNAAEQFHEVIHEANRLIQESPALAEAWNQRAIAYFHLAEYETSASDCHQTLELNPYHYGAAVGMAHCYLELNDAYAALDCFRRALKINPGMEGVRVQVDFLERTLEET